MAKESPLFQSSLELFAHAIEHFNSGAELDRKLVILHLANSVELIFKDLLLDLDVSIYKGPNETVSIHAAIKALKEKEVDLPFLNKIELLIDERNALQHRYGSPNELTMIFYMDSSYEFMKSLLDEQYALDLEEVLTQFTKATEIEAFRLRKPREEKELEQLKTVSKVHPLGAFLAAYNYLDSLIRNFLIEISNHKNHVALMAGRPVTLRTIERYGIEVPGDLSEKVNSLRQKRNRVAHGKAEVGRNDVEEAVKVAEEVEKFLLSQDVHVAADRYREARKIEEARFFQAADEFDNQSRKESAADQVGAPDIGDTAKQGE